LKSESISRVAVLGAGVMGAQIAAHCANANVNVILFDLPGKDGNPNGVVAKALDGLKKLEPSPLATKDRLTYIEAANYEQHLEKLRGCDLIIEAIAEKFEWKRDLYTKVAPFIRPDAAFVTNTSGLSINGLAEAFPEALRSRFCGVHFFNPPRYMHLAELIPCKGTDPALLDGLEAFLTTGLGKGIVRAMDTPNFVANRVGVFSMLAVMYHTERLGLSFDAVDAVTGPLIGRPKSATYRTVDVVGIDTLAHVIRTMTEHLKDDPWHPYYLVPEWMSGLIAKGALGQKTRGGIFTKKGKDILVLDLKAQDYRPSTAKADPEVVEILKLKKPAEKFAKLRTHASPQAQFLWALYRDVFHYVAVHLDTIADNARDVDLAMRWGFGWAQGPFENWQAAGWQEIANAIKADIDAGKAMVKTPLPAWVFDGRTGVHSPEGSFSAKDKALKPRSALPLYKRQWFPELVLGETQAQGTTIFENEGVRMWTAAQSPDIPVLSFKSKMHVIGAEVMAGVIEAVARAEKDYAGLVIWQDKPPFSAGANLYQLAPLIMAGSWSELEKGVAYFQQMTTTIKYAKVPVVAAINGMALGGGCEIAMHSARAVATLESYIGLVEAGVGLIPAGGGSKEFAVRAAAKAQHTANKDPFDFIQPIFTTVAMATVSKSASEAKELGFLRDSDVVIFNADELLHVATAEARGLAERGYRPALPPKAIPVAGRNGISIAQMVLVNMKEGGMISEHDMKVSTAIATAMCGGDVESGTLVDEEWLLAVERRQFVDLLKTDKTQARIMQMLETGKPLRN
jgi:3-hydroxyacyl-CoA dehydrogenase